MKQKEKLQCSLYAKHIKINEISVVIESPIKFSEKTEILLNSDYFEELKLNLIKLRTVDQSKPAQDGNYHTEVTFRGMTEEIAQSIRKIKKK